LAKGNFVPRLPADKPTGKVNKAAPQGDYSLKATQLCDQRLVFMAAVMLLLQLRIGRFVGNVQY